MCVEWTSVDSELHHARWVVEPGRVVGLQVESLLESGWDWHVWDSEGLMDPCYGLADSLEEAKFKAEAALDAMLVPLDLILGVPSLALN